LIGKTLGKYRIVEQLGRGGMAEVYKAYHPSLDRYVAIKLMHSFLAGEEGFVDRFRREARSVARLRHPNIVQMHDFDAEGDVTYMVMEFLEGPSLKHKLSELETQGEWLTLQEAVRIIRDVGEALDYAHRREMVHRDVKPANIMLTADGGAILTDFGIVKMLSADTQLTASGAMIGTPAYMAPEQSMGAAGDDRADIYSLGIVLYQLATGRLPYDADTPMAIVLKHLNAPLPIPSTLNPDLPEGVERVILKALAKDPDDRYQSVREMLDHLDQAMRGGTVPAVDPSITMANQPIAGATTLAGGDLSTPVPATQTTVAQPMRRFPVWVWGLAGLAVIAALVGGFALLGGGDKSTPTPTQQSTQVALLTETATPTVTGTPRPTNTPDQTATVERALFLTLIAPTPTGTPAPTPTDTPPPTDTPDQTAVALANCTFDATLDEHVTIRPGQYLRAGASFEKTWRLRNSGDCAWPAGTTLIFVSGDQMGAEDEVEVEPIAPGETVDVSVAMRAPNANGSYAGAWQIVRPTDVSFGEEIAVQINVGPTPTPRATSTPRPTATPWATATPTGPLEMSIPSILGGSCWSDPNTGTWGATLAWSAWGGTGTYEYYFAEIRADFKLPGPEYPFTGQVTKPWSGTFYTVSGGVTVKQDRFIPPSECGY
jgi:hypothetical protein